MIIDNMKKIIEEYKKIDPNDDELFKVYFNSEVKILTDSLDDTIYFLDNASEEDIYWSCTTWEEVARHFKSEELIKHMEKCVARCKCNKDILTINLEYAKKYMNC